MSLVIIKDVAQSDHSRQDQVSVNHSLTVGDCQQACRDVQECHWFTWDPSNAHNISVCFLSRNCNNLTTCDYCISGVCLFFLGQG